MSTILVEKTADRIRQVLPLVSVFEDEAPDRVEGTQSAVIEVRDVGPWSGPANGARHRVVQINILSDPTRDEVGTPAGDADAKAWTLWETVDGALNDVGRTWSWAHSSRRADGPVFTNIPDGDGGVMLSARYEVSHD